ncbi:MAG: SDR family oxidoreductase [Dehalococcoidia bacterium]|nr:SDR family oxidoreductase [Dehalococcoidia bacterium]
MKLQDRVAIVTGGARGIGEGIARAFAEEGAKVAILDLDGEAAAATAAAIGNGAIGFACDVAADGEAKAGVARVVEHFGGLDILANNAGAGRGPIPTENVQFNAGVENSDPVGWDETLSQNLRTTFLVTKYAVPHLKARGQGSIVNTSSIAGITASPALAAYAAAKAGVISFTRSMALELAPALIRVNAIGPGFLYTRAWEGMATLMQSSNPAFANLTPRDVFLGIVKQGVPMGREQTPEDIGKLAAFLASEDAKNITGQFISVDGGITLR